MRYFFSLLYTLAFIHPLELSQAQSPSRPSFTQVLAKETLNLSDLDHLNTSFLRSLPTRKLLILLQKTNDLSFELMSDLTTPGEHLTKVRISVFRIRHILEGRRSHEQGLTKKLFEESKRLGKKLEELEDAESKTSYTPKIIPRTKVALIVESVYQIRDINIQKSLKRKEFVERVVDTFLRDTERYIDFGNSALTTAHLYKAQSQPLHAKVFFSGNNLGPSIQKIRDVSVLKQISNEEVEKLRSEVMEKLKNFVTVVLNQVYKLGVKDIDAVMKSERVVQSIRQIYNSDLQTVIERQPRPISTTFLKNIEIAQEDDPRQLKELFVGNHVTASKQAITELLQSIGVGTNIDMRSEATYFEDSLR